MSTEAAPLGASGFFARLFPSRRPPTFTHSRRVSLGRPPLCLCGVASTETSPQTTLVFSPVLAFWCPRYLALAGSRYPRLRSPRAACRCPGSHRCPQHGLEARKNNRGRCRCCTVALARNDPCDTLRAGPMRVEGPLVVLGSTLWSGGALLRMWSEERATPANGRSGPGKADHPSIRVYELRVGCAVTFTVCSDRSQVRRPIVRSTRILGTAGPTFWSCGLIQGSSIETRFCVKLDFVADGKFGGKR